MPQSNLPTEEASKITQNKSNKDGQLPKPYTQYTIFFRLERMRLLYEAGFVDDEIRATLRPGHFDKIEHPRPARYRDVEMPPFWYSSFAKHEQDGKRKHSKKDCRFPLKELSQKISANWKEMDEETAAYTKRLADWEQAKYLALLGDEFLKTEEAADNESEETTSAERSRDVKNSEAAMQGQSIDNEMDIRQFQEIFFPDEPQEFSDAELDVPTKSASIPSPPVSEGILKRAQMAERFNKAQYHRIHQMQSNPLSSDGCRPMSVPSEEDEANFYFPREQSLPCYDNRNSCFKRSSFYLELEEGNKFRHPPLKRRASVGCTASHFDTNNILGLNAERPITRRGSISTSAPADGYAHDTIGDMLQLKNQAHQRGNFTARQFQDHSSEWNDFNFDFPALHSAHPSSSSLNENQFSEKSLFNLDIEENEYHLNDDNLVEGIGTMPFKKPHRQTPITRRASVGGTSASIVDMNKRDGSTEQLKMRRSSITNVFSVDWHSDETFEHPLY
ncbi:hypothetical protein ACHAXS_001655 [Conticribra weissflogii]